MVYPEYGNIPLTDPPQNLRMALCLFRLCAQQYRPRVALSSSGGRSSYSARCTAVLLGLRRAMSMRSSPLVALLCSLLALLVLRTAAEPRGRQLLIANATGVGTLTTFGTATKHPGNPLLKLGAQRAADKDPVRPWASGSIYTSILADQTGKRSGKPWRAYFTSGLNWTM
jgi:hypothetical protein